MSIGDCLSGRGQSKARVAAADIEVVVNDGDLDEFTGSRGWASGRGCSWCNGNIRDLLVEGEKDGIGDLTFSSSGITTADLSWGTRTWQVADARANGRCLIEDVSTEAAGLVEAGEAGVAGRQTVLYIVVCRGACKGEAGELRPRAETAIVLPELAVNKQLGSNSRCNSSYVAVLAGIQLNAGSGIAGEKGQNSERCLGKHDY